MNLLVSYNWLKDYVKLKQTPEQFAARLSLSGPSVERIHRRGEGLEKVVVGKILAVKPHPNADKLRVVETDLGAMKKDIVCGGSNLAEGQLVAVALPGAMVKWHGEGEPVEIKEAKLRGVDSYGMICGADEVGLLDMYPKKGEREVVDLTDTNAAPGTPLADALGLGDVVFDMEVTTNRPDAMCIAGIAREASAILGAPFAWKPAPKIPAPAKKLPLSVEVKAKKLCPRYEAVAMTGAKVAASPAWLRARLASAGLNSINNLVDITNYVMLELGQPMHVFDHKTLKGGKIVVREAAAGEKMKALDGNTYQLKAGQLVIADAERPVAIAGVMGGEATGVSDATADIVFEAATFDPVSVRRTSRGLNLMSDSSLRFEKGLSTESTGAALARAVELAKELAGAEVASAVVDKRAAPYKKLSYPYRPSRGNQLIGIDIPATKQRKILTDLGFTVAGSGAKWRVSVPSWRDHDIEGERDLVEEVARVYGYDNLPSVIPEGPLPLPERDEELVLEGVAKRHLKDWGYTEVMTYSFVSKELAMKAGGDVSRLLRISNPLTEEFEYMRDRLGCSMLEVVARNQEEAVEGKAFELANVYHPRANDLPLEAPRLFAASWSRDASGADLAAVKGVLEALLDAFGVRGARIVPGADPIWHPGRSGVIEAGGARLGVVGEFHPAFLAKFGIDRRVAAVSLDFAALAGMANDRKAYLPIPEFPPVKRDLAFTLDRHHPHAAILDAIRKADPLVAKAELFDVFEDAKLGAGKKSVAYHLEFALPDRTLTAEEADAALERIRGILKKEFQAETRL